VISHRSHSYQQLCFVEEVLQKGTVVPLERLAALKGPMRVRVSAGAAAAAAARAGAADDRDA